MFKDFIEFRISGEPEGKGRARSTKGGIHYTPTKTRNHEAYIRMLATNGMITPAGTKITPPTELPCEVNVIVWYSIPKSTSKKIRQQMIDGTVLPTKKPDCDNILKSILDACNGVVFDDDKQVVKVSIEKHYGESAFTIVQVKELKEV